MIKFRFAGIFLLLGIMAGTILLTRAWQESPLTADPGLKDAIMAFVSEDLKLLKQEEIAVKRLELAKIRAQLNTQIANIPRTAALRFWGVVTFVGSVCVSLLIVGSGAHRALVKARQVHLFKIGDSQIVVHERDLSMSAQIAMGLINAEQLKQMNGGTEKAFELYARIADMQKRQLSSHTQTIAIPPAHEMPAMPSYTPSFQELLHSRALAPGQSMILGYEQGQARRGSFLDIYSSAIAGESGSGKTSTMLFLIGSGLMCQGVRFLGIDPHYPHPNSLGFKTRPLWEKGLIEMATNAVAMEETCEAIETTIDNRLKQRDTDTTPVVLVIDELAFLSKTAFGKRLTQTMARISMEGRKCAVYMLASSQTWLADRTGGSSVVRDTLTSAYVHRIKPKQANLLLQDRNEAEKVKQFVKRPGQVLFLPVNAESAVVEMPLTTEQDMIAVSQMISPAKVNKPLTVRSTPAPVIEELDLIDRVKATLQKSGDFAELVRQTGFDKSYLSKVLNRKKAMSAKVETVFQSYLQGGMNDENE